MGTVDSLFIFCCQPFCCQVGKLSWLSEHSWGKGSGNPIPEPQSGHVSGIGFPDTIAHNHTIPQRVVIFRGRCPLVKALQLGENSH